MTEAVVSVVPGAGDTIGGGKALVVVLVLVVVPPVEEVELLVDEVP